jgi:hypothetical protein
LKGRVSYETRPFFCLLGKAKKPASLKESWVALD